MGTPLTVLICPTRRNPSVFHNCCIPVNDLTPPPLVAKTDYAANLGDCGPLVLSQMPASLAQGDTFQGWVTGFTGVIFVHSQLKIADVTDGCSQTYLLGEKPINSDYYLTGLDSGDDWSAFSGQQDDVNRLVAAPSGIATYTYYPPLPDTPGLNDYSGFGSAHANGLNMSFCDGSVQKINYSINPEVHRRLGNRKDGQAIDGKEF